MATDVTTLLTEDHRLFESLADSVMKKEVQGDARADAINTLIRELSVHAIAEEIVLYPEVRDLLDDGDQLADEALEEHQRIKEALAELDGLDPEDERVESTLASVVSEVLHHAEEEENVIFARLRQVADAEKLEKMGASIDRAKKVSPTRPHTNAPDTPPLNLVVGPPVALIDRIRDALSR